MNSDNPVLKKRENPFARTLSDDPKEVPTKPVVEEPVEPVVEKEVHEEPKEVKKEVVHAVKKPAPVAPKQKKVIVTSDERVKYTATMDKALRFRVKIAAFKQGVDFSTYIEQACAQKLEEDGE
ncbi:MAG: hypothetical protein ACOX4W_01885 [Bacilli bacterium]|jgi:hypothetical protein